MLAIGAAAAAFFAIAGTAQAQDCVSGYRMIKGQIPIQCDSGFVAPTIGAVQPAFRPAPFEEPLTTGSIGSVNEPTVTVEEPHTMTYGGNECVGGYWYRAGVETGSASLPMRCQ